MGVYSMLSRQSPKHFNGSFSFTNRFMMMSLPCYVYVCTVCVCVLLWSLHNGVHGEIGGAGGAAIGRHLEPLCSCVCSLARRFHMKVDYVSLIAALVVVVVVFAVVVVVVAGGVGDARLWATTNGNADALLMSFTN